MLLLEVNDAWVEVFKGPSKEGPSCFAWRTKLKKAIVDEYLHVIFTIRKAWIISDDFETA